MTGTMRSLANPMCETGECPLWNETEGRLYFADVTRCRIWRYNPDTGKSELYWAGDMQVGGLLLCTDGGMLLFTDKGVFKRGAGGELTMLYDVGLAEDERFNDAIADTHGRVFAGTMKQTCRDGRLFRFERGAEPVCVLDGLGISNGMGFSVDGNYFYHTDSVPRAIRRYRYDAATRQIRQGRLWYQSEGEDECPDGMTVDSEDCVWAACWGGGRVVRLDVNGRKILELPVPAVQVSSLTFGAADYKTVYITSAARDALDLETGRDEKGRFLGGLVYEIETDVEGRAENLADF